MPKSHQSRHELLLPVGNKEMALAAIHNGADAIYVGFPGFNARGRTVDLALDDLKELIDMAHAHGVKVNLALNILIFQNELQRLAEALEKIIPLKPDAFIVQDLGVVQLIRQIAPEQVIHASTQMTITNHEAISLLDDLRIKRFVLGRENSIEEIKLIKAKTEKELEVFVHGALCVAYSGQCFTSEGIGGRSANRGQCAQSCRFAYEMIVDGKKKQLVDRQHLVSPQDLCGIKEVPALMDIGVHTFKIEGRLKTPDYVASAASEYRQVIDLHEQGEKVSKRQFDKSIAKMATTYSRGFFSGWLHGVDHQKLVNGRYSAHRGHRIGQVQNIHEDAIILETSTEVHLKPGDGIMIAWNRGMDKIERGAQIYECRQLERQRNKWELKFSRDFKLELQMEGAGVWLNHDGDLKKELFKSWNDKNLRRRVPVEIQVKMESGQPLRVTMSDGKRFVQAMTQSNVEPAKSRGVEDSFIAEELAALGGTQFEAVKIQIERSDEGPLFIAHKELKEVRRQAAALLDQSLMATTVDGFVANVKPVGEVVEWIEQKKSPAVQSPGLMRLNILLREIGQVEDLVAAVMSQRLSKETIDAVILDFEFGRDYQPAIEAVRSAGLKVGIATTRILKPQEYNNLKVIERLAPDIILVRNLGSLRYFTEVSPFAGELRGDFSLNVTNHLSASYLLNKGLHSVCASYDLNHQQVSDLLHSADANKIEISVLQYMPSFHMEHCVFAAFLSKGSSFKDCGKPCEQHIVELEDQFGHRHQIKPDQECRNTMYSAVAQSALKYVPQWKTAGLGSVRMEALRERGEDLLSKIQRLQEFILGKKEAQLVVQELGLSEKYGLAEGNLAREIEYASRKKNQQPFGR